MFYGTERTVIMAEEKSKTTLLRKKLMMTEPKGVKALSEEEIKKADSFCDGYKKFLDNSPLSVRLFAILLSLPKKQVLQSMSRTMNIRPATGFIM